MKKVILTLLLLLAFCSIAHAESAKPTIVILYTDNLAGSQSVRDEAKQAFFNNIKKKYESVYNVTFDNGEKLNTAGYNSPIRMEKADIIPFFNDAKYVLIAYAQNYAIYGLNQHYIFMLKIIEIDSKKYLFNGEFNLTRETVGNMEALKYFYNEIDKIKM